MVTKRIKPKSEPRRAYLTIRLTEPMYDRLERAATRERRNLSEFVRMYIEEWDAKGYQVKA